MSANLPHARLFVVALGWLAFAPLAVADPAPFMMRAVVAGRLLEGQPLEWSPTRVLLLGRDGALHDFAAAEAKEAKRTADAFAPYTTLQMQAQLREEFGVGWDATATAHFVVAHPAGPWSAWAERLEGLFGNFTRYMQVRGMRLSEPPAPLAAIVFRNQQQYYQYAAASGSPLQPGTMGHYDPSTNRIYLFDAGRGGADWASTADTIIHEATHQAAFNTGVHTRFAEQPRWLVEGLAMMFESSGVWNPGPTPQRAARINRERLQRFRRTAEGRSPQWIAALVASDTAFAGDVLTSYAEAWTLTFYLSETQPQLYSQYLQRAAARPLFGNYPTTERVGDFTRVFGGDWAQLAAALEQFVGELP